MITLKDKGIEFGIVLFSILGEIAEHVLFECGIIDKPQTRVDAARGDKGGPLRVLNAQGLGLGLLFETV
jgi:hypothetical protein